MRTFLLSFSLLACAAVEQRAVADTRTDVATLVAADRTFAAAAADKDVVAGLSAMMDDDVVMLLPTLKFGHGKAEAVAALTANAANAPSRMTWQPAGAGISADGKHGFTVGYISVQPKEGAARPGKYLAYWIKRPAGWRVAVYKRAGRPEGDVPSTMAAPVLPEEGSGVRGDAAGSLDAAEHSFSDTAGRIGLGPAFKQFGSARAINMGGRPAFTVGAEAIGTEIGSGPPANLSWAPETVLVAGSGDLGVTWGFIHDLDAKPGAPVDFPYVTVWRREGKPARWAYIAE